MKPRKTGFGKRLIARRASCNLIGVSEADTLPRGQTVTEIDLTIEQARDFISNNDAYGTNRLYGSIGAQEECAGQIIGIKSNYHLDRLSYDRIYVVMHNADNLLNIRKA